MKYTGLYTIPEEGGLYVKDEDDRQTFKVETEDGVIHTAELVGVVEIDGKEYAVYAIPGDMPNTVDILASYVVKDEDGYDTLVDIYNPLDKAKITNYVKSLM